ncbi:DUF3592 domain-containing protein [Halobium palmae]|uniref:DUF3592 domain-containing protein n=1 Tax=Halobium palmae TaxID=1776492 RepID=A0ABD5RV11_9EURY
MSDDRVSVDGPETLRGSLILVILALAITGWGAYDYVQSTSAVQNSMEVEATVSEVEIGTTSVGSGAKSDVEFRPNVAFTYAFRGQSYTSDNLFPGSISPTYETESAARDVVSQYEPNTTTIAYVNPENPENAFLKNRVSDQPFLAMGIGVLMTLFGVYSTSKNYRG